MVGLLTFSSASHGLENEFALEIYGFSKLQFYPR